MKTSNVYHPFSGAEPTVGRYRPTRSVVAVPAHGPTQLAALVQVAAFQVVPYWVAL